jgi:hypothetical protein
MTDENDDLKKARVDELKASADDAKEKFEKEHRRSLEVRASFFDKLSALDAGSIAVAVSTWEARISYQLHALEPQLGGCDCLLPLGIPYLRDWSQFHLR